MDNKNIYNFTIDDLVILYLNINEDENILRKVIDIKYNNNDNIKSNTEILYRAIYKCLLKISKYVYKILNDIDVNIDEYIIKHKFKSSYNNKILTDDNEMVFVFGYNLNLNLLEKWNTSTNENLCNNNIKLTNKIKNIYYEYKNLYEDNIELFIPYNECR